MAITIKNCQFCGKDHGALCPEVKAIEYFPNGRIKRVEFKCASDNFAPLLWNAPISPPPQPPPYLPMTWGTSANAYRNSDHIDAMRDSLNAEAN